MSEAVVVWVGRLVVRGGRLVVAEVVWLGGGVGLAEWASVLVSAGGLVGGAVIVRRWVAVVVGRFGSDV